ncbi:NADP oxidoreductase coenzyme F420-dependent [Elizabethkingia miricola]|jgi:8-hydroxy-5-deazaflavin:NADPH oxidoreductase|uniref:NADP oxidoreductase coenzyme F420-dependent n=1 Tax=Elizabethkingia miricola TaxID=172045 RepID=A0ABD4DNM3_ELIMR|nr:MULTISPECIES: NAD(P)-binding domain-containing protein [Elizabethkingia]KUY20352.1 NADP oxidoreductase coenzyme F420-dependent [Elizabethkingia miricola]MCL1653469.1 NAD(P)-binding domain-containing protein [Elizabethkingia miricola]MCL1679156.1 NAD(P)-binding domain-containing protein [Elizabethkingia miricola]OPC70179.1 NADP oxidoreductase coenzyme F420-dependent [Elizabethkingia miricola]OPC74109.1 NADP oxidoreductase coenzyme F420-dependent [Elizabethkingia miricola]
MNTVTKVAIIGLGNIGKAVATNLTKGNHPVIIASRELSKAQEFSLQLGDLALAKEITEAIKQADVIIPTIYYDKIKEFLKTYAKELQGKIIIDVSNPIAPDDNGGFKKIIDQNQSAGKILSALLPPSSILVKAFGTLAAATLTNAAFNTPERKVLFYASDNIKTNKVVEELITASGFVPFHIGGIDQSIRIEVFGDLHEFGALGKTVTLDEARQIVTNS